jgi:hypothetical protein
MVGVEVRKLRSTRLDPAAGRREVRRPTLW